MSPRAPSSAPLRRFCIAASLLALLAAPAYAQIAPSPAQLLETLRASDAAYEAGFTCSGTSVNSTMRQSVGVGPSTIKWTFTCSAGRRAYREETIAPPELAYIAPRPEPGQNGSYDPDGRMIVGFPLVATCVQTADLSGLRSDDAVYALTATTKALVSNSSHMVVLAPATKGFDHIVHKPFYCAGRGLTQYIEEITVAEETKEGLVVAEATGNFDKHGAWRITVDPKAGYIIRSAEFTPDGSTSPSFRMSTSGLKWAGDFCVPEKGSLTGSFWDAAFVFDSVEGRADTALLDSAESGVRPPFPPTTNVIDSRVFPPTSYAVTTPSADDVREKAASALAPPLGETADEPAAQEEVQPAAELPARPEPSAPASPSGPSPRSLARRVPIFVVLAVLLVVGVTVLTRKRRPRR